MCEPIEALRAPAMSTEVCYHCDLPIPAGTNYEVEILGRARKVCCPGCQAVATAIRNGGHERFYGRRTAKSWNPGAASEPDTAVYDNGNVSSAYVSQTGTGPCEVTLNIPGINCGACLWLIESYVRDQPGINSVVVNYTTRRAIVNWDGGVVSLGGIVRMFKQIGFAAYPYEQRGSSQQLSDERDRQLRRLGVAGVLGMQITMIAVALYFGGATGMRSDYESFFKWVSLVLVVPIVTYSARPFFEGAWRSVRFQQPSIDVPVALAIGIASIASVYAVLVAEGETYFEAIAMFVFFLLSTRYFELVARNRGLDAVSHLQNTAPMLASRIDENGAVTKLVASRLQAGDRVRVGVGETVPVDGHVVQGESWVDESIISGESTPVGKGPGDRLLGGAVNLGGMLSMQADRTFESSLLSNIARLAERAQSAKPRFVQLIDRIAIWFVIGLVVVSAGVALYCWFFAPERLIPTLIAVLVIACPCALSLATPAAVSASIGRLVRSGIIPLNGDCLEKLPDLQHTVFDKTGTLTLGVLGLIEAQVFERLSKRQAIGIAAVLEHALPNHPMARSLSSAASLAGSDLHQYRLTETQAVPGAGVSGVIEGTRYYLGSPAFMDTHGIDASLATFQDEEGSLCLLADESRVLALLRFSDELRSDAKDAVEGIKARNLGVSILSGDGPLAVEQAAGALGIDDHASRLLPHEKLEVLSALQTKGKRVLVVGDGVNDAPMLSAASVGVAMGSGSDLTRVAGDAVLLNSRLGDLLMLLDQGSRTRRIIRQNFVWAAGYNSLALPLGIAGWVSPWIAVLGMSVSSLVVVVNSLRLSRIPPVPELRRVANRPRKR